MKNYFYYLIASLMLVSASCDEKDSSVNLKPSEIAITVPEYKVNSAIVAVFAKDVKTLGNFTIGVCFSTNAEPTMQDLHSEIQVKPDTLLLPNMTLSFNLTNLTKGTKYYVKGYIKSNADTYYSSEENFTTKNNILTISVSNDYIPSGMEYWIVLSDKSTTLLTQKIQNNQSYTFSDNIPDFADFHIFKMNSTVTPVRLNVESYTGIVPDNFSLDNPYTSSNVGQITVTVSDIANYLRWGIATLWWSTSTTATRNNLTLPVSNYQDELFINYIPSDGTAPKYKYVTDINPNTNYTYTMANLTTMTNYVDIPLPSNSYFSYTIAGINNDYYTDFLRYHGHTYSTGYPGTFKLYYPAGIKSNYYWLGVYTSSNQQSVYYKLGALPTVYFSPFPTITIANSSKFITTTSGINNYSEYEVMDFRSYTSNSSFVLQWDYYKQPQATNSVQIPDFPSDVKLKINNLSTNDMLFNDVSYFDILNSKVTSYTDYVDQLIKKSSRFYDVIKERRLYYQYNSKGTFDPTINDYEIR